MMAKPRRGVARPDLNLLITLDALLSEGSVVGAARRLRLSPSAMSRALTRVREVTGDPLLVRAGRGLAPTPRALALRERVHQLVEDVEGVLRPAEDLDIASVERTFTLRTSDGFVEAFGAALIAKARMEAPLVRLNFIQKPNKDSTPLRDGVVDLETGVVEAAMGPEVRTQALFRDRLIGVIRQGHPLDNPTIGPTGTRKPNMSWCRAVASKPTRSICRSFPRGPSGASPASSAGSRRRSRSPGRRTWSLPCPTGIRPVFAKAWSAFRFRCRRSSSPCRCCGIPEWMPTWRTDGSGSA